jgi:hypothetical protein
MLLNELRLAFLKHRKKSTTKETNTPAPPERKVRSIITPSAKYLFVSSTIRPKNKSHKNHPMGKSRSYPKITLPTIR